jgi:hypothetical protein
MEVAMNITDMADKARLIPLDDVLRTSGLNGVKEGRSVMYRSSQYAINVTGHKWFDHKSGRGGAGAIDLAMYLHGSTFEKAVLWLNGLSPQFASYSVESFGDTPRLPFHELKEIYANRDDNQWPHARKYLIQERHLDPSLVDRCYEEGKVYANDLGGIVFLHSTPSNEIVGASIRSIRRSSSFRQSIGDKTTGWFWVGSGQSNECVITESPIEALSYLSLRHRPGVNVYAISGSYVPEPLLLHLQGKMITIALNNDYAGHAGYEHATSIARSLNLELKQEVPPFKDWNEWLKRVRLADQQIQLPTEESHNRGMKL